MNKEEFVNEKYKFPIFIGINGIMANCSSGLFSIINTFISYTSREGEGTRPTALSRILNSQFSILNSQLGMEKTVALAVQPRLRLCPPTITIRRKKDGWRPRPRARPMAMAMASAKAEKEVLIVNTNSGGHAIIGFWLARDLKKAGHQVTIFTAGEEASAKMTKPPFSRFSELRDIGVQTIWGEPAKIGKTLDSSIFDVVLENNGKDLDSVKLVADWAKRIGAEQFLYVSSAGIYMPTDEPPHVEGDIVKIDSSHVVVEDYIRSLSFDSLAIFRPQYMVGSGNNKDCEEWFFDRIVRDRPVPIPGSGMQVTNIVHVKDLSSMLVLAVQKPFAANGNIFNAVCDRAITFDGLVKLCARVAGKEADIVHYDPKSFNIDAKKAFPFRNMHFYAEPRAAKEILGWQSTTNLQEDLKERFEEYIAIGRDKKDMKFDLDDKILESSRVSVTAENY